MVLGIIFKLTPNAINKSLGISKIFLEESLKVGPRDRSGALVAALMLGSSEANSATKEYGSKGGTIHPCGTSDFEIILTLLIKVVAIYVGFSGLSLRGPSFEWLLLWLYQSLDLSCFHEHFYESGEEILSGRKSKR